MINSDPRTLPIEEVKKRLFVVHGTKVSIDESTYVKYKANARFIDVEYGEWWAMPSNVITKKGNHPKRAMDEKVWCDEYIQSQKKKFQDPEFQKLFLMWF